MIEEPKKYHSKLKFYYDKVSFYSEKVEIDEDISIDMKWKYYWLNNHVMAITRLK